MTLPESSNDFGPQDWSGDRGSMAHDPHMCQACETLFWGHESRTLCRQCETAVRETYEDKQNFEQARAQAYKLRRLLVWMLPPSLALWIIIYLIVRAWLLK